MTPDGEIPAKSAALSVDEETPAKSVALSVLVGLALFLLLVSLLVLSAGFDASKFIYVDF